MSKSILQQDLGRCWLCGEPAAWNDPLDKHHVFGGALRRKSERDGLWVKLHHYRCHEDGPRSVHRCAAIRRQLQEAAQRAWMKERGAGEEAFRAAYYKSYI